MSDLRKAAEMALEALEWNYGTDLENIENCTAWLDKMNATIPALRQALAMENFSEVNQEIEEALRQALAQPEWVGLTEDEWHEVTCIPKNATLPMHMLNAIETKLKEKNT